MEEIAEAKVKNELKARKWGIALWAIGGVSAVIWATNTGRKGRFWWFIGGGILGSAVGLIIDNSGKDK
jgi:hypothetical protein